MRRGGLLTALVDWRFVVSVVAAIALGLVGSLAYSNAVNERRALNEAQAATTSANGSAQRAARRIDELQAEIGNLGTELAQVLSATSPEQIQAAVSSAAVRQRQIEQITAARPIAPTPSQTVVPRLPVTPTTMAPAKSRPTTTPSTRAPSPPTTAPLVCVAGVCVP